MMRREGIEIVGTKTISSSTLVPSSPSSALPSSSSGRIRCQDCGNQAKRDCEHLRCRTCCKSRRFQCHTHVKSTWVPVSLRRRGPSHFHTMHQQHQIAAAATVHQQHHMRSSGQHGGLVVPNPNKRYRQQDPAPLGLEERNFPGEVSSPAVFRCVRVSSVDNEAYEYAYQTSVSIGGHVFTGILHDQGPETEETVNYVTGRGSSSAGLLQQQQHPHPNFVTSTTTCNATGTTSSPYPNGPFCAFNSTTSSHFIQYPKS